MDRFCSRFRKVTGTLPQLDDESVGRDVATGWLRPLVVVIDPSTGQTEESDWRRMRAEASTPSTPAVTDSLETTPASHA